MLGAAIEYKSGTYHINGNTNVLETKSHQGIKCVWSGKIPNISVFSFHKINFTWKFDWNKLRNQGVDEITGQIIVRSAFNVFIGTKIDVKLTENNQEVTTDMGITNNTEKVYYQYSLTPHYTSISEKPSYEEMFAPSDQNDTILIVDGKKLHVNKTVS
ncbi:hypothetical protein CRE_17650 [Caenorhabditis remanei]|uniref:Uncharacterized protein n=1 Tax=Caenorhabditis remanei TaxID=31234 RepID=E3NME8_CAERE|nr:hypothetical protein CRE_17650 [Caenorhabditis remanei]